MTANVTIAGEFYVSLDPIQDEWDYGDISCCSRSIVIEFETEEALREAMRTGTCKFKVFGGDADLLKGSED